MASSSVFFSSRYSCIRRSWSLAAAWPADGQAGSGQPQFSQCTHLAPPRVIKPPAHSCCTAPATASMIRTRLPYACALAVVAAAVVAAASDVSGARPSVAWPLDGLASSHFPKRTEKAPHLYQRKHTPKGCCKKHGLKPGEKCDYSQRERAKHTTETTNDFRKTQTSLSARHLLHTLE